MSASNPILHLHSDQNTKWESIVGDKADVISYHSIICLIYRLLYIQDALCIILYAILQ